MLTDPREPFPYYAIEMYTKSGTESNKLVKYFFKEIFKDFYIYMHQHRSAYLVPHKVFEQLETKLSAISHCVFLLPNIFTTIIEMKFFLAKCRGLLKSVEYNLYPCIRVPYPRYSYPCPGIGG
jgi:hypothetical protein